MSGTQERRVVLVRHAKAVPKDGVDDFDRPLADRGRADATATGRRLAGSRLGVALARCSSARRTRQTWQLMLPSLADRPPTVYDDRLYNAGAEELLAAVTATDDGVSGLLLVGHNPGIQELATALAAEGLPDLLRRIAAGLPTCAVAVVDFHGSWTDLAPGTGRLTALWAPGD
ncbi:histidine phosphatase family protein [Streptomyces sp. NBC_00091]|uniref:SixA phosphatase family protein n=1 Tax=Streptomyces sp. NBC_00091 TaxID=2975648 RepID=UPI00225BAFF8|nr:histidine phosphatase family protein [Streptomyces sp. NBC_00091]MCX5381545.1 histidine phosphatase family protein [Streptomyces sp. NBC_00091]